jgi:hypothetical protein
LFSRGKPRENSYKPCKMIAEEARGRDRVPPGFVIFVAFLRRHLGLDRAIAFTVLARGWTSASGLVTVALIARLLSPAEQGYYYTFSSLIALQMVFELGFSQVIMQLASHERAHLTVEQDGRITGDEAAHARLASTLRIALRWYGVGALLFAAVLIPAGIHFFSAHQYRAQVVPWRGPWICAASAAAFAFFLDPMYSFSEGCGFVSNVAHMRWVQAAVGSILAWTALLSRHGLYAPAMVIAGQVVIGAIWLSGKRDLMKGLLRSKADLQGVSWKGEIWPLQWRIAIAWISGYFVYQTFNPFLFAFKGPMAAGQMGMSLSIANSIMFIAMAWVSTKAAPFGSLIAKKRYAELDSHFFRAVIQSTCVAAIGVVIVWTAVAYLNWKQSPYALKVLGPVPLGLLLVAGIANHLLASMGTYLRAHKQEVLFQLSVAIALAVLLSNYFFAKTAGATGMVAGYLVIMLIIGVGGGVSRFVQYRKLWHSGELTPGPTIGS